MDFWLRLYTHCIFPSVALGTASLKFVVEAVYLGYIISSNLKDDSDVYKQVKQLNTIGKYWFAIWLDVTKRWNVNSLEHIAEHYIPYHKNK